MDKERKIKAMEDLIKMLEKGEIRLAVNHIMEKLLENQEVKMVDETCFAFNFFSSECSICLTETFVVMRISGKSFSFEGDFAASFDDLKNIYKQNQIQDLKSALEKQINAKGDNV